MKDTWRTRFRVLLALACMVPVLAWAAPTLEARLTATADLGRFVPEAVDARLRALEHEAHAAPLPTRAEFLFQMSMAQHGLGKSDRALALAAELEKLGKSAGNHAVLSRAVLARAIVFRDGNRFEEAAALSHEADRLAGASGDPVQRVRTLIASGLALADAGDLVPALTKVQEAVAVGRTIRASTGPLVNALSALGSLYDDIKEYRKGLDAIDEAWTLASTMGEPAPMATLKAIEYSLAVNSKQDERAVRALLVGQEKARQAGATRLLALTLVNLADAYLRRGDYAKVIRYGTEGVALATPHEDRQVRAAGQLNLGQAYMATGQLDAGKRNFEAAMAFYDLGGDRRELQLALVEYGNALEKAGDLAGANKAYHRERALSNELFEAQRQKLMIEMQEKYDTEKRQREILRLSEENFAKSAELKERRLQQRIWWLLALVFALVAIIVGLLYRRVRQANAQLEVKNQELKVQSSLDPLTGLYNRRHFQDFMQAHLRAGCGGADDGNVGALFLLDVDHFKGVNDRYGHAGGDAVLKTVAASLREILRETDMIVRWGGEEFLAFLPAIPRERLDEVARRILAGIADCSVPYQEGRIGVTVSIGYAPFPLEAGAQALSWERIVNLVDLALYLSKSAGRNRAHGVKGFRAGLVASDLERVERDLEGGWRAGLVEVTMVQAQRAETTAAAAGTPITA